MRFVVIEDARSQHPSSREFRSVNGRRAYDNAVEYYNSLVSQGRSAVVYSSLGRHLRSWKPNRGRLVSF